MNLDIAKLGSPVAPPYRCSLCPVGESPILDTGIEFPGVGRVYICKRCSRDVARLWGFSKGKALDELMNASEDLKRKDKQVDEMNEILVELTGQLKVKDLMIKALESDKENLRAELAHLNLVAKSMKDAASA